MVRVGGGDGGGGDDGGDDGGDRMKLKYTLNLSNHHSL